MTEVRLRPLAGWPYPATARRRSAPFSAGWADTKRLLATEVDHLCAGLVVVEIDVAEGEQAFRVDGNLRASARTTDFPGVRVSFDSRHGPLTYATDRYEFPYAGQKPSWQANARAIALSLQALRAVDRHGVTRSGEQYRGWQALPPGIAPEPPMTVERAAQLLVEHGHADGMAEFTVAQVLAAPAYARRLFVRAARQHHPDVGGDRALFERLVAARDLLAGAS